MWGHCVHNVVIKDPGTVDELVVQGQCGCVSHFITAWEDNKGDNSSSNE